MKERLAEIIEKAYVQPVNEYSKDTKAQSIAQALIDAGVGFINEKLIERTAQCIAHRACCGSEHDPANGKIHGYCIVCGVPFPCEYAGEKPTPTGKE